MNGTSTIPTIKAAVAEFYGLTRADLDGPHRDQRRAWPRQVAMTLSRELTSRTLPTIGNAFGRHHTTVLHATRSVYERTANDEKIAREVDRLRLALKCDRESWLDRFKSERLACEAVAGFFRELQHGKGI